MSVRIYGASDDLIEIDGDVIDEYDHPQDSAVTFSASDGTEGEIQYAPANTATWRITVTGIGTGHKVIPAADVDDTGASHTDPEAQGATGYSDVLVLHGKIEWVRVGRKKFTAHG